MRKCFCALMALSLFLVAPTSRANSVEISFVSAVGGVFLYDARVTPNNQIVTPDDVVYFYDFAGFVSGSFAPSPALLPFGTYTFSEYTENDSAAPGVASKREDLAPGDDATPEVRFNYTGSSFSNTGTTDIYLGRFTLTSVYTGTTSSWTQSTDTQISPVIDNINLRPTIVAAVPLPAAAWAGFALFGGLGLKRFRRNGEVASA